jgi:hypothetical protein
MIDAAADATRKFSKPWKINAGLSQGLENAP